MAHEAEGGMRVRGLPVQSCLCFFDVILATDQKDSRPQGTRMGNSLEKRAIKVHGHLRITAAQY